MVLIRADPITLRMLLPRTLASGVGFELFASATWEVARRRPASALARLTNPQTARASLDARPLPLGGLGGILPPLRGTAPDHLVWVIGQERGNAVPTSLLSIAQPAQA